MMKSHHAVALGLLCLLTTACTPRRDPALVVLDKKCEAGDMNACEALRINSDGVTVSDSCRRGNMEDCRVLCQQGDQFACFDYNRGPRQ